MDERDQRAEAIIRALAASFIQQEANPDPLITVTRVDRARDGRNATVFISVFPEAREADALVFLKRKGNEFRDFVKRGSRLKHIPFFEFSLDYTEKHRRDQENV